MVDAKESEAQHGRAFLMSTYETLIEAANEIARSTPFVMHARGLPTVCYVCPRTGKPTWVKFTRAWLADRLAERLTFRDGDGNEIPPRADIVAELHRMILDAARHQIASGRRIQAEQVYAIGGW